MNGPSPTKLVDIDYIWDKTFSDFHYVIGDMILSYLGENQTEEICRHIIWKDPQCIRHVIHPSHDLFLVAVYGDWKNLRYIKMQTPEICKIALDQNKKAMQYVKIKLV